VKSKEQRLDINQGTVLSAILAEKLYELRSVDAARLRGTDRIDCLAIIGSG
jgi:hypothetical protein